MITLIAIFLYLLTVIGFMLAIFLVVVPIYAIFNLLILLANKVRRWVNGRR